MINKNNCYLQIVATTQLQLTEWCRLHSNLRSSTLHKSC